MKPSLIIIASVFTLAACNNSPNTESETKKEIVADTSTNYSSSVLSDTGYSAPEVTAAPAAKVKAKEPKKTVTTTDKATKPEPVTSNPAPATSENDAAANTSTTDAATSTANTEPEAAPAEEKKGWSNAAKGTVIGAGAGAIGGAIISKKKGKGAIIGGVVGAAGGYIIGRNKDKKDTIK